MGSLTFRRQESLTQQNQTGQNRDEVARLHTDHPDGPKFLKDGRVLGLAVTQVFGDSRWKWSRRVQEEAQRRLPVVTTAKIEPESGDFLTMASDNLWDHLTNEQAVD